MDANEAGRGSQSLAISNAVVKVLRDYTGRGPTRARTTIGRDEVMVVMGDTMTKGERKLADNGRAEHVLRTRHEVQKIMREALCAEVERIMERKVIAFMSDNHVDPDMGVEAFVLERVETS